MIRKLKPSHIFLIALSAMLMVHSLPSWAGGNNKIYYSKCTVAASPSGAGSVYVNTSNSKGSVTSATQNSSASSAPTHTYYIFAEAKAGYYFASWAGSSATVSSTSTANTTATVTTNSTSLDSPSAGTCTATFTAVGISAASPASVAITLNDPDASADYTGSVVFTTSGADAADDFKTPTFSGDGAGTYTVGDWSYASNTVMVPYTFNAGGSYSNGTKTLTLTSAGGENSKAVTFTITRPNIVISGGDAGTQLTPSTPTADAEGTATFDVQYTNGASEFTAAFSNISGGGTWSITSLDYTKGTDGNGVIKINYTMNPASNIGDHSADLTLTASTAGGATYTLHPTAVAEAVKDYDVEVFDKNGTSIYTGAWAGGITKVNANEGSTIQLARDVDLGTLTAHGATFTKTTTLDLNGKTLSATSASGKYLIYLNTANKTLTIKDSKNGGTISAVGSANTTLYAVYINQGNLVLNSGKIYAENQLPYASGTSVSVRALQLAANVNFTMNGGEITGEAGNSAYGIRHEGGATATGKVIINDGTINANCKRQYAYGIYELGKLEVHGGTINAKTYTSTGTSDAYGIYLSGGANMDTSKEYDAELTMDGGTINAQSQTSGAYGVYVGGSVTIFKDAEGNYQHSLARAYPAVAYISGGTFNAFSTTSGAYGLRVMNSVKTEDETISTTVVKPTIVTGGTFNAQATTSGAYGIMADAQSSWGYGTISFGVVEVSNVEATATTGTSSAYGAYVNTNAKIFDEGNTKMNYHNTYKVAGEWVAAGKMTIHSGTFTGIAGTSTAAGVGCATRAAVRVGKTSDNVKYAYGELNIDGGTFSGKTTTSTAYGVLSGGNTTITGGTFSADATTSDAYGVYTTSGKTIISNVPVTVVARGKNSSNNGNAYGLIASCSVADMTGIAHPSEIVANNLTVNVTTTTGANARGVSVSTTQRTLTDATFNALSATNQTTYAGMYVRGEWATAAKATINGGTYTVTSATTYAYGARLENASITASGNTLATGELEINGGTFTAKTQGTTTAYGVYAGGKVTIDGATFNVQPQTTTAYGLYVYDKKATVSNSTFNVTSTSTAHGIYLDAQISSTYGYLYQSELESTNNTFDVKTTTGNTAQAVTLVANKRNIASGTFAGDYVAAAKATINSGTYKATATGTTAYGIVVPATVTQGSQSATAHCEVNGGIFIANATSTFTDVNASAPVGALVLNGGYYKTKTNLDKYKTANSVIWDLTDGEEYTQGCRYAIAENRPLGVSVCKIGSIYFQTLEAALVYTQQNSGSSHTIIMISDYILPAGNYTLPSNATLLVPWKADQTSAKGSSVQRENNNTDIITSSTKLFRKLTFASGVKMTVEGTIEVGGIQNNYNNIGAGVPIKAYGQLLMEENSSITLVSGAKLMAWGYITGQGTIDARRGSTCYEMFQILDFRGGTCTYKMNNNSKGYFPLNQYYIQNIEVPVTFHPGAKEYTSTAVVNTSCDNVQIIGTERETALFTMNNEDDSEDTWVRKSYDPVHDRQVYEINSAAKLNAMTIELSSYTFTSSNYVLPITNNIDIHLLSGQMEITQNVSFLCGSTLEIDKEATGYINSGKSVFFYDTQDWVNYAYSNVPFQPVKFSPSWANGKCPRSGQPASSSLNIHGTMQVNGAIYTTANGSNIFSTNDDAGTIVFNTAAPSSNKSIYECNNTSPTYTEVSCVPALLRNGDNTTVNTSGTPAGKSYCYINDAWRCMVHDGCFDVDKTSNVEAEWIYYAKPGDYVALSSNTADANHLYHSQDLSRHFILMAGCQWWDVVQTEEDDAVYYCADNDTYYYYTGSEWTEKVVTITWQNWDGSSVATYINVPFGSKPKYLGTNPKRAMDNYYTYDFIGWLPEITDETKVYENTTYIANYEQNDRLFQITFKDGSTTIETDFYSWGSMPVCEKEPKKAGYVLSWSPALGAVSGAQTYTAVWTAESVDPTTLKYTVTWKNYEGTTLQTDENVTYGVTPTYNGATPTKPSLSDVDFVFSGWTPDVAPVTGNAVYTAAFSTAARKYTVTFKNQDGTTIETQSLGYGETPVCQNPPTQASTAEFYYVAKWDKQITAVTGDAVYTCTGFTAYKNTCRLTVAAGANGSVLLAGAFDPLTNIYDYGTEVVISATAAEHYHFAKWSDGNTENPRTVTVTQTTTLTALFAIDQVTVTWLNYDGNTITTTQVDYGTKPSYSGATPNRPNGCGTFYTFSAWSPNPSAAVVTAPTSFAAQYDEHVSASLKSYQVAFDANGGMGTMTNQAFTYDVAQKLKANEFTHISYNVTFKNIGDGAPDPWESASVGFAGWKNGDNTYSDKEEVSNLTDVCDAVVTMQAQWTASSIELLSLDPRTGYTFQGWYDAESGGNKVGDEGDTYVPSASISLYAHWSASNYTITYTDDEGEHSVTVPVGTSPSISDPTKAADDYEYEFDGWENIATHDVISSAEMATQGASGTTYRAHFAAVRVNNAGTMLDIVDWLPAEHMLVVNANAFPTNVWPCTVTVAGMDAVVLEKTAREANRTLKIAYSSSKNSGEEMMIKIIKGNGDLYSRYGYVLPTVVSTDQTFNARPDGGNKAQIWVKGCTATINASFEVSKVVVAADASLVINSGKTLTLNDKLVLRTTAWTAASFDHQGTLSGTVYYSRIVSDKGYYQFGLPLPFNTANVVLSNGATCTYGTTWLLKSYNEATRAENGADDQNWNAVAAGTVAGGKGYEMYSNSAYYREYYFPVNLAQLTNATATVAYTADGAAGPQHAGWNALCSPLTGVYTIPSTIDPADGLKICRLEPEGFYTQYQPTEIMPAVPFYYQASANGQPITFGGSEMSFPQAVAARGMQAETRTQWLQLSISNGAEADRATIYLNSTKFTADYDPGYDVEKLSTAGSRPIIYTSLACGNLAFAAVPDEVATNRLPLTVYSPQNEPLTLSLADNDWMDRLDAVYLIDEERGSTIDLMLSDYQWEAAAGTTAGRFFLLPVFRSPSTATDVAEVEMGSEYSLTIVGGNLVLTDLVSGTTVRLYDAAGRLLLAQTATSETMSMQVSADGVYLLQVGNTMQKVVLNK